MAEENVEIVRSVSDAWNRGDSVAVCLRAPVVRQSDGFQRALAG